MRRAILIALSFIGSALFLALALRGVSLEDVWKNIQSAQLGWVIVGGLLTGLGIFLRGMRWRVILSNRISTLDGFYMLGITNLINQLPLRAGEVARGLVATRKGVPFMTAATGIILERLIDTLLVVVVLAFSLAQVPNVPPETSRGALLFGILALFGFVVMLFFARRPQIAHQLLAFFERLLPILKRLPLQRILDQVLLGLEPLTHWRGFVQVISLTVLAWVTSYGTAYALALGMGIEADLLMLSLLAISFTAIFIAIPVSVASLGPFQGAAVLAAQLIAYPQEAQAVAFGFLLNGISVLVYLICGGIGLFMLGISLGEVFVQQPKPTEEAPPSNT